MRIYFYLEYLRAVLYIVSGFIMILVGTSLSAYFRAKTEAIRKEHKDGDSTTDT